MGRFAAQQKAERIVRYGLATWEELIEGAKQYAKCDLVAEGYVCMPITWLNQGRWADEYETAASIREEQFIKAENTPINLRTVADWRLLLGKPSEFNHQYLKNNWQHYNGPAPGEPGCLVPAEILREYGFIKVAGE